MNEIGKRLFLKAGLMGGAVMIILSACQSNAIQPSSTLDELALAQMVGATLTAAYTPPPELETPPNSTPPPSATIPLPNTVTTTPTTSATPEASPTSTPTPTSTPVTGLVSGAICFTSSAIPEMTVYFQNTTITTTVISLPIVAGQSSYEMRLEPGTYIAFAWLPDFSQGGLYSRAVPCGLKSSCKDHSAIPVVVGAGDRLNGIDVCDWYGGPFAVPYPPGFEPQSSTGAIDGTINYPFGALPALHVVATNVNTGFWYWVGTAAGQAYFTIEELPPGTYHVVAYAEDGKAGGYANDSHQLVNITVRAGQTSTIAITDWEGNYPGDPTR